MAEAVPVDHPALAGIPLVLGGNVFGWTIDRDHSFAVLDAFYEAGGRMIDTADGYSNWVPGNKGGESETIIRAWLESRGVRAAMRIGTKTGQGGAPGALRPESVAAALEASLERLRTDYVDLYYAHRDDPATPLDEVVAAFGVAVASGKARALSASNYSANRLEAALQIAARLRVSPFTVLQPLYNLVAREEFEGSLQDLCVGHGLAVLPYYGLASGFLSGKYHTPDDWAGSSRARGLEQAAADGGWKILAVLREVAAELGSTPAQVALAWLNTRCCVAAPLVSATTPAQVADLVQSMQITIDEKQLERLNA